jgi:hypothetical protein
MQRGFSLGIPLKYTKRIRRGQKILKFVNFTVLRGREKPILEKAPAFRGGGLDKAGA